MINSIRKTFEEYPGTFWTLMGASFIDRLGGALLFPFFALYVTNKFNVGLTEVGVLFAIFAVTGQLGNVLGGALTDKYGRKSMIIFGLVTSALGSVGMGLVTRIESFFVLAAVVGILGDIGGPAQQAMVADLLPEKQRSEGYGIWRVVANLAVMLGPLIGGLMADRSYMLLFITDAVSSAITALIVFLVIPETRPEKTVEKQEESLLQSFKGYSIVFKDLAFVAFIVICMFMNIVYLQMNTTLPVFMRDVAGMPIQYYGYILSMNAGMVVFFQFWITRRLKKFKPMLVMAAGAALYMIGFGMYGFTSGIWLFTLAMVIITIGEMLVSPVSQALVAKFAPEDMRGRYMATYSLAWTIPFALGTYLAGLVMDNHDPNWVWYAAGILAFLSVIGFLWLNWLERDRMEQAIPETEASL